MNAIPMADPDISILVVDDTVANLRLLSGLLRQQGYNVRPIPDGMLALKSAMSHPPDIVLLDIMMPSMSGFEVCRALKAHPQTSDIPIIFISALNDTFDKVQAFAVGGVDYITKPFQAEEVLSRVKTHVSLQLSRKRLQAQNAKLEQEIQERKQAETELQYRNEQLAFLARVGQLFSSSLELRHVLKTALTEIEQLLHVVSASFWLMSEDGAEIACTEAIGPGAERLISLRLKVGDGITGWVAEHGESLIVRDTQNDPRHIHLADERDAAAFRSMISVPLRVKGNVIGVLNVVDLEVDHFSSHELLLLEPIATAAAIAIENARLYAQAQQEIAERRETERALLAAHAELRQTLDYLQRTQSQLVESEKMAALGQLIAGIAHEINSPLAAIRSSVESVSTTLGGTIEHLPNLLFSLSEASRQCFFQLLRYASQKDDTLSSREERQLTKQVGEMLAQYHLNEDRKLNALLVSMGVSTPQQVAAVVPLLREANAHGILAEAYHFAGLHESTRTIMTATDRASKVVFALKSYAHYDQAGQKVAANLLDGIETALTLYHNQIKHHVEVVRQYQELPPVSCFPDELTQVWTNLIHNALQAMSFRGMLTISARRANAHVVIGITDTGIGVPDALREKIFEPFFTTKPSGEGSGLGLDIVKKIIDKHRGEIHLESRPGQTTFEVWLPL